MNLLDNSHSPIFLRTWAKYQRRWVVEIRY